MKKSENEEVKKSSFFSEDNFNFDILFWDAKRSDKSKYKR